MVDYWFVSRVGRRRIFEMVGSSQKNAYRCRGDRAEAGYGCVREKLLVLKEVFEGGGRSRNRRCSGTRSGFCIDLVERHRDP